MNFVNPFSPRSLYGNLLEQEAAKKLQAQESYSPELGRQSYQALMRGVDPLEMLIKQKSAGQTVFPPLEQSTVTDPAFGGGVDVTGGNDLSSLRGSMSELGDTPDAKTDPFNWRRVLSAGKAIANPGAAPTAPAQSTLQAPSLSMKALEAIPAKYLIPLLQRMKAQG